MISIEKLTKYYDKTCAVDQISFEVKKGEILGMLGPNGAGKTTTMRIITCYLRPTSGMVRVKNLDIKENPIQIKKSIGYLPEFAPLYPDMFTYEYLHYIAAMRGLRRESKKERVHHLADLCGLNEVMHKHIRELSRGYKQRVGLAHSMMSDPEILVLDEPTSGLDPNQIVEIRSIIKEIGKTKTVILSTHILSEAEATCDRIVIINNGRIVADGSADTIKASGTTTQVTRLSLLDAQFSEIQNYLSSIDDVRKIEQVKGVDKVPNEQPLSVRIFSHRDVRADVFKAIKVKHWILIEMVREQRSLENIFRQLTKASDQSKEE